jgi:hypothetical protein
MSARSGRLLDMSHTMRNKPMAELPGPSDYRARTYRSNDGGADTLYDAVQDLGERAGDVAGDVATAVKERPYTTMAIAGGLAFAIGTLWMMRRQQPQSRLDALLAQLPEPPKREALLRGRWR